METREERGIAIAKAGRLRQRDHLWVVPSQSGPGIYIVEWRALTADTHKTEGAFVFRVGE